MATQRISALVLGGCLLASSAQAGDMCLDATGGLQPSLDRPIIIGRGFKFPKKNKCKPFIGVIVASSPSHASVVTGSACARFDGTSVTFMLTAAIPTDSSMEPSIVRNYVAAITPSGPSEGTGRLSTLRDAGFGNSSAEAFECSNAFPDNL